MAVVSYWNLATVIPKKREGNHGDVSLQIHERFSPVRCDGEPVITVRGVTYDLFGPISDLGMVDAWSNIDDIEISSAF